MKTLLCILALTLCTSAFCESDKYLVLTDGNKEVFCDSVTVTEDGYRAVINGETKEYKFSEAMLKMKAVGGYTAGGNPAPVPEPKKVATDKPKKTTYIRNGKEEPLNKWVQDYPGSRTVHARINGG